MLLSLSLPRSFGSIKDVAVELIATYMILDATRGCVQRTLVMSAIYPVSKDPVAILRSVNPKIVRRKWTKQTEEIEFVRHLYEIYKTKVLEMMPGGISCDPFFTLFPNLQLFLRFLVTKKAVNENQIIESEAMMVKHMPMASFWSSQDSKIEEEAVAAVWSHRVFNNIVCVLHDCGESIDIFMDEPVEDGSLLDREIKRRVCRRFPIPKIQRSPRSKFILNVQSETEIANIVRTLLEPKHSAVVR